jgi:hypothetical protein
MFFKSLINTFSSAYGSLNNDNFDKVNPNIVNYFRNEYGTEWQVALEHHLYKERSKNDKKAA